MALRTTLTKIINSSQAVVSRKLHLARILSASQAMEQAKARVTELKDDPGNEAKLKLYALFKQASSGPCDIPKPGVFDFVGQAKWSAWSGLGDMSKEAAEKAYIDYVNELAGGPPEPAQQAQQAKEVADEDGAKKGVDGVDVVIADGVLTLTLNRPKKLNSITKEMYNYIRDVLNEAANNPDVKIFVLTGAGNFYCAGNDLSNFTQMPAGGRQDFARDMGEILRTFVEAFIHFPKPLVAAVNGPAIGIPVTTLGLCDLVYASSNSTFHCPFMTLGQSAEGCSSYLFPKIMGYAKANDVLLGGRKLTAQEAFDRGLLTDIYPHDEFRARVNEKVKYLAGLPPKSMMYGKALTRNQDKEKLIEVNIQECLRLEERWVSDECLEAVMAFLSKKKAKL